MMLRGRTSRPVCRLATVSLAAAFACAVPGPFLVRADDDIVAEEQDALEASGRGSRVFNAQNAASQVASLVENYEHQVFMHVLSNRRAAVASARGQVSHRQRVDAYAADWLRRIDAACGLNKAQRNRLQVAVRDDLESVIAEMEADIARYKALRFEGEDGLFQQKMHAAMTEDAARVREMLAAAFDRESRFFKVLPTTLTAEQQRGLDADFAARRAGRWAAAVASMMDMLDPQLGLTRLQHDALEQALLARQPALRTYPPTVENSHVRHMLVCIELAAMDEDELRAIVNERQWSVLGSLRQSGEMWRLQVLKQGWYEP